MLYIEEIWDKFSMEEYKSKKIIAVDDEEIVLSTLKMLLNIEGFDNVEGFTSPQKALEYIKDNKPDLIISDFVMPQMNGIEFLSEAKKLYSDVSMILLTGYADKENAIKAINEVGIYKYIEKPWDNEDLLINIRNGIERSDLISRLNQKIEELSAAKSQLEKYSQSLEELVMQKTADLVESNTKLSAIINYCADGIVIISSDLKILQANPAFENLTGLDIHLLENKDFNELVCTKENSLKNITSQNKELLLRDVFVKNIINEKQIPVEISFAPILSDKSESKPNFVAVVRNVSLQKEMERLRDDFIATLTHDLRTPLLAAIQTLQFFLDGTLGHIEDKPKTLLDTMKKSNEDMLGLVNALLEVYKYESGKLNLCKTTFELKKFINECIAQIQALADKKNIEITVAYNENSENAEITADRNELRRVILNLCGNALNHTKDGGKIEITVSNKENDLILNVKDNGIGIPSNDLSKLFKRFSQGTSQKRSAGTGLGLYLSRQIIEAHNGKIWVESKVSEGSVFSFMIPDSLKIAEKI